MTLKNWSQKKKELNENRDNPIQNPPPSNQNKNLFEILMINLEELDVNIYWISWNILFLVVWINNKKYQKIFIKEIKIKLGFYFLI